MKVGDLVFDNIHKRGKPYAEWLKDFHSAGGHRWVPFGVFKFFMNISKVFEEVLERPGMFIGYRSITRLYAFMDGYWLSVLRTDPTSVNDVNDGFNKWVAARFNIRTSHNWSSIILFMNGNDETNAFDMAKELWQKYRAESQDRT